MSEQEIKDWMKKNYPEYADNLELGKILYAKFVKKQAVAIPRGGDGDYQKKRIVDVKKAGERVIVSGLVVRVDRGEYFGCAMCKRKVCSEHKERRKYYTTNLSVGDDSGLIWCGFITAEQLDVKEGDEVEIRGRTKDWKGKMEVMADNINFLRRKEMKDEMDNILDFVEKSGKVKTEVVQSLCKKKNLDFEEVRKRLREEDGYLLRV